MHKMHLKLIEITVTTGRLLKQQWQVQYLSSWVPWIPADHDLLTKMADHKPCRGYWDDWICITTAALSSHIVLCSLKTSWMHQSKWRTLEYVFLWISNDSERLTGLTFSSYVEILVPTLWSSWSRTAVQLQLQPIHISQWPSCEAYLITASDVVVWRFSHQNLTATKWPRITSPLPLPDVLRSEVVFV